MKSRCGDKNNPNYGGKGISVCDEWLDFKAFEKWAYENGYEDPPCGARRADCLSIDRIDSSKGYNPENCRWIPFRLNAARAQAHTPEWVEDEIKRWKEQPVQILYGSLDGTANQKDKELLEENRILKEKLKNIKSIISVVYDYLSDYK